MLFLRMWPAEFQIRQEADIGASGHMVMLERREAVERAMERFLFGEGQRSWRDYLLEHKPTIYRARGAAKRTSLAQSL